MYLKGIAVKSVKEFVEKQFSNGYRNWIQALPEDSKKISEVADFVKNLVPENIWTDMEKRQKEFEESFEN